MKPNEEEMLTQWIDGELDDAEVAELLEAHPEWKDAKAEAQRVGNLLRSEMKAEEAVPYPDFFNHQIRKRILEEEEEAATEPAGWKEQAALFPWFTRFRLISGTAFVALLVGFVAMVATSPTGHTEIVSTYTPNPGVTASMEYSDSAKAMVIRLDGLDEIPATQEVAGFRVKSYQPDIDARALTLEPADGAGQMLVLSADRAGLPEVRTASR